MWEMTGSGAKANNQGGKPKHYGDVSKINGSKVDPVDVIRTLPRPVCGRKTEYKTEQAI